jgi:hypothetical protein
MPTRDWRGFSYASLLRSEWAPQEDLPRPGAESTAPSPPPQPPYDPTFLDDPNMVQGKNRQVSPGFAFPSLIRIDEIFPQRGYSKLAARLDPVERDTMFSELTQLIHDSCAGDSGGLVDRAGDLLGHPLHQPQAAQGRAKHAVP